MTHITEKALFDELGWIHTDYDWDMMYDCNLCVGFEYRGHIYIISCEEDSAIYDNDTGKVLYTFSSKEDFYSLVIFGRPIKDVIDESRLSNLW